MLDRARTMAGRLTPMQKIALGAVVITVVVGGLMVSRSSSTTAMAPLFTDLASADASSVVDELNTRGVAYDLTDAGRTVLVPKDQVYNLRVEMAGQGLPASNEGYALLDNQGITTSEFRQRVDYQRAMEGRPSPCRFTPSFSSYAVEALRVHGNGRGFFLTLRRLLRCRPFGPSGWDPVPEPSPRKRVA